MREIEFRGKDLENKWRYGFYSPLIWYPSYEQTPSIKEFKGGDIQIKKDTLCQYTGLKDKNGQKIFEGDILERFGYKVEIFFKDGSFCYTKDNEIISVNDTEFPLEEDECEIIGNVFDNPELLKEKEDE